jgi:indole-3-glycerol phosphate synthase
MGARLERFALAKGPELDRLRALEAQGGLPAPFTGKRPSLAGALRMKGPGAVIAEYKRASPSAGDLNLGLEPEAVARGYAWAGAAALSVLTEESYFKGSLDYLARMTAPGLPLLRKDFLFDPLQVRETASTPASALLLIARMFESADALRALHEQAQELGLEAVVEVFDGRDLDLARAAGAKIIQVNSRDLDTLVTDLDVARRLVDHKDMRELWIAASGISRPAEARELAELGYDGLLVGSSLMSADDPAQALSDLVDAVRGEAE